MAKEEKPSELFQDAFRAGIGTTNADCELCGVHVFCSGSQSLGYDKGELEELQKKAKEQPDKYVEWADSDGVSIGKIGGKQFIIDHDCPALRQYENFIWAYRFQIAEYLTKRAEEELEDAQSQHKRIAGLSRVGQPGIERPGPG